MADANAIVLRPPIPPGATEAQRRRALEHAADFAKGLKLRELRAGKGVSGKPLVPVLPESRPDGADGAPLSPHRAESRSQKWLRVSIGYKGGTVTLWWSHGWGTILGYHKAGIRRRDMPGGKVYRDVIGLTPVDRRAHDAEMARWWQLQGVKPGAPHFVPSERSRRDRHVTIRADVERLNTAAAKDAGYYVGPNGTGAAKPGAYRNVKKYLERSRREGVPVDQPEITVDADGTASFTNGRHTFAAHRDSGAREIPVSVPREHAARARAVFGKGRPPLVALPSVPLVHIDFHTKRAPVPKPTVPQPGDFFTGYRQFGRAKR